MGNGYNIYGLLKSNNGKLEDAEIASLVMGIEDDISIGNIYGIHDNIEKLTALIKQLDIHKPEDGLEYMDEAL